MPAHVMTSLIETVGQKAAAPAVVFFFFFFSPHFQMSIIKTGREIEGTKKTAVCQFFFLSFPPSFFPFIVYIFFNIFIYFSAVLIDGACGASLLQLLIIFHLRQGVKGYPAVPTELSLPRNFNYSVPLG